MINRNPRMFHIPTEVASIVTKKVLEAIRFMDLLEKTYLECKSKSDYINRLEKLQSIADTLTTAYKKLPKDNADLAARKNEHEEPFGNFMEKICDLSLRVNGLVGVLCSNYMTQGKLSQFDRTEYPLVISNALSCADDLQKSCKNKMFKDEYLELRGIVKLRLDDFNNRNVAPEVEKCSREIREAASYVVAINLIRSQLEASCDVENKTDASILKQKIALVQAPLNEFRKKYCTTIDILTLGKSLVEQPKAIEEFWLKVVCGVLDLIVDLIKQLDQKNSDEPYINDMKSLLLELYVEAIKNCDANSDCNMRGDLFIRLKLSLLARMAMETLLKNRQFFHIDKDPNYFEDRKLNFMKIMITHNVLIEEKNKIDKENQLAESKKHDELAKQMQDYQAYQESFNDILKQFYDDNPRRKKKKNYLTLIQREADIFELEKDEDEDEQTNNSQESPLYEVKSKKNRLFKFDKDETGSPELKEIKDKDEDEKTNNSQESQRTQKKAIEKPFSKVSVEDHLETLKQARESKDIVLEATKLDNLIDYWYAHACEEFKLSIDFRPKEGWSLLDKRHRMQLDGQLMRNVTQHRNANCMLKKTLNYMAQLKQLLANNSLNPDLIEFKRASEHSFYTISNTISQFLTSMRARYEQLFSVLKKSREKVKKKIVHRHGEDGWNSYQQKIISRETMLYNMIEDICKELNGFYLQIAENTNNVKEDDVVPQPVPRIEVPQPLRFFKEDKGVIHQKWRQATSDNYMHALFNNSNQVRESGMRRSLSDSNLFASCNIGRDLNLLKSGNSAKHENKSILDESCKKFKAKQ